MATKTKKQKGKSCELFGVFVGQSFIYAASGKLYNKTGRSHGKLCFNCAMKEDRYG